MKNKLFILVTTVLLSLATVLSASACGGGTYQPEVPESLRR